MQLIVDLVEGAGSEHAKAVSAALRLMEPVGLVRDVGDEAVVVDRAQLRRLINELGKMVGLTVATEEELRGWRGP